MFNFVNNDKIFSEISIYKNLCTLVPIVSYRKDNEILLCFEIKVIKKKNEVLKPQRILIKKIDLVCDI